MAIDKVVILRACPFRIGQKIKIEDGPRKGDWEVTGIGERKIKLRCPISLREFEWNRFCYFVNECDITEWPNRD
jgi:hypothetical protein